MINQTQQTLYRLDNLNAEQKRLSYQMSTGKKLENGSDDAVLYSREIYVDDKIRVFEGIQAQLTKTTVHNNVSDTAVNDMKKLMEQVKAELLKATTSTTTDEGKKAIAVSIAGVKQNLLDLANTRIDGEYLFSGSNSSVRPFTEGANGDVTYNGDTLLRKIAVEEGSYRDKGVNGFDIMMYPSDVATKSDPNLSFKATDRIVDADNFEWKLNSPTNTQLVRYDIDGNATSDTLALTNDGGTPPTYTADLSAAGNLATLGGSLDGVKFEAKTSIFDALDNVVDSLNKVDSLGNPITDAQASANLTAALDEIDSSYDAVNVAHAELGGRNKVFEVSEEKVMAKLTQYNILSQEIGAADLSKVAVEAKALELTFTALYSTINKTNELSLVNFIR